MRSTRDRNAYRDWTNMTMSDWMETTPSQWMDRLLAGWESGYGDMMNTSPTEWWQRMYGGGTSRPMGYAEQPRRRHRHHHHQCHCDEHHDHHDHHHHKDHDHHKHHHHAHCKRCGGHSCECYCCLGDVDLAVYTRVGEQRVIQIVVENERHREKEVSLELSDWTTRGGKKAPVETVFLEPKKFTIPPCGEQEVTLVIRMGLENEPGFTDAASEEDETKPRERIPDVDDCLVVTADLRLVGCDHRPLRIAAAIVPRDCDPYRVHCGCTCC